MGKLRAEEEWARRCIRLTLGDVEVLAHDDGSTPGMFDLEIIYRDGRRGAAEVTAAADSESIELWNLVNGGGRWIVPYLKGGWTAGLYPSARAKRIKTELPGMLQALERDGIPSERLRSRRFGPWGDRLRRLGVGHLHHGPTEFPGSIYLTIELPSEKSGGMVPTTGDPLAKWVAEWSDRPSQAHNLNKLRSSGADEQHLFVIVPSFPDAPFEVIDLLMRNAAPLPRIAPAVPRGITHIWCMSTWNSGDGMRWSDANGWLRFDKQAATRSP